MTEFARTCGMWAFGRYDAKGRSKPKLPRAPLPKQRSEPFKLRNRPPRKPKHPQRSDGYDYVTDGSYGR